MWRMQLGLVRRKVTSEVALEWVGHLLHRGLDQEGHLPAWYLPWLVSQLSVHQLHVVVH